MDKKDKKDKKKKVNESELVLFEELEPKKIDKNNETIKRLESKGLISYGIVICDKEHICGKRYVYYNEYMNIINEYLLLVDKIGTTSEYNTKFYNRLIAEYKKMNTVLNEKDKEIVKLNRIIEKLVIKNQFLENIKDDIEDEKFVE